MERIQHQAQDAEPVSGFLHLAERNAYGLVLTHGAGGNCNSPLLVALAERFCDDGVTVLRCDLPFRQKRPHGPPSPSGPARDRAGLRSALQYLRSRITGRIFLGGQSYGGRQASILVAEDSCADGLLLLSYPLHPPGKPEQQRTVHFPALQTPALFVSGTRDPFASPEELRAALRMLPGRHELLTIDGAGHDLWPRSQREKIPQTVVLAFNSFFRS